jgi:hypothetical protein
VADDLAIFELPSYEEPVLAPPVIPVQEEPRKQIRGYWSEEELKVPPWEKRIEPAKGAA